MKGNARYEERKKQILEQLNKEGAVKVTALSQLLKTSVVTIRSDLARLEKDGFLKRTTGGAVLTVNNLFTLDLNQRRTTNLAKKREIAQLASKLINDGDTLIINSGTSTLFTAQELKRHKNLNIVTNSLEVAMELGDFPTFNVILIGGEINAQYAFTFGGDAVEQLKHYKADWAILSIDGISVDAGLTSYHADEAVVVRSMIERSRRLMVVADSSKVEHEGFTFLSEIFNVSCWVTDSDTKIEDIRKFEALGITVVYPS